MQILITFVIQDDESNPVDLTGLELAVGEAGVFLPVPCDLLEALPANMRLRLLTSPTGVRSSLTLDISSLGAAAGRGDLRCPVPPGLVPLSRPGFKGNVRARVLLRDFSTEDPQAGLGAFLMDTNDPPAISVKPILPEHLKGGIVPLRYFLFDPEAHRSSIEVQVDLGDGKGSVPAYEFPSDASSGMTDLPADCRSLVFLWDAISQLPANGPVTLTITPKDDNQEQGIPHQETVRFSPSWLSRLADLPAGQTPRALATADLNGDGFSDVVVADYGNGNLLHFRGGPDGLTFQENVPSTLDAKPGAGPRSVLSGRFWGDELPDVAVANEFAGSVTFIEGRTAGLRPVREVPAGAGRLAVLSSGDYDGDGHSDVAAASSFTGRLVLVRGSPAGPLDPAVVWNGSRHFEPQYRYPGQPSPGEGIEPGISRRASYQELGQ